MPKRGPKKKNWVKIKADEVLSSGPFKMERFGRFVRMSSTSTPEQHAQFLKRSEEVNQKIFQKLETAVPALQALVQKHNPIELMHLATYMLLPLFMEHKSESDYKSEETFYLPAVEYLQYLIARTGVDLSGPPPSEAEWDTMWQQTLGVLRDTHSYLLTRKTLATPPSEIDELRFHVDSRRLAIRGRRYPLYLVDHFKSSFGPYDQWIREVYGITAEEAVAGLQRINEYQMTGVVKRYREFLDAQKTLRQKLVEKGYLVSRSAGAEDFERTKLALASEEFEAIRNEVDDKARLTLTPAIFDITDLTSLPTSFLSLLSIKPGEAVLNKLTGPDHDDLSPLSSSLLHYKPFMECKDRYYTCYHSGFVDHISDIIESDLFQKRPAQISTMCKKRSDQLEKESLELLASIITPDVTHLNLYYPDPDNGGALTELDAMLGVEDILFLVEAKAGGFSDAAVRGAPRQVERDLSDLIIEGQHQSERAEKYIRSADEVVFYDHTGRNAVRNIRHSRFRRIFRIIVTREDLGWVGARIAILAILDPNLSKSFPWHISLDDLRVVSELFKSDGLRFVHFLEQRLQASRQSELVQHDEIDHVGLYNAMNLYHNLPARGMDRISFDSSYMRDIDAYFAEKTAGGAPPRPTQKMPDKMAKFLDRLQLSHLPGRFEVASMILSMDEASRHSFQRGLRTLREGETQGRQRTFRMPFTEPGYGFSITTFDDAHLQEEVILSAAHMHQGRCDRWAVIRVRDVERLLIDRIEIIYPGRFTDVELTPGRALLERKTQETLSAMKVGRNDKCPCGSGLKYKKCHGLPK